MVGLYSLLPILVLIGSILDSTLCPRFSILGCSNGTGVYCAHPLRTCVSGTLGIQKYLAESLTVPEKCIQLLLWDSEETVSHDDDPSMLQHHEDAL